MGVGGNEALANEEREMSTTAASNIDTVSTKIAWGLFVLAYDHRLKIRPEARAVEIDQDLIRIAAMGADNFYADTAERAEALLRERKNYEIV
jgi:hypothetical protein